MKRILFLTAIAIVLSSALTIYLAAQGVSQGITQGSGAYVSGVRIFLLKAITPEEGSLEGVQIVSPPRGHDIVNKGTLRIEMLDGSVQEIPILKVKRAMIDYGL
jgi:hypothetical protein